jgi:hypothetical protein
VVGIGAVKQTGRHRLARPPTLGLQTVSGRVPMREISCAVLCWTWTSVRCCCHRCRQTGWRDRGLFHAALYGGAGAGLILLSVNTLDCMESALPDRSRSPVLAAGCWLCQTSVQLSIFSTIKTELDGPLYRRKKTHSHTIHHYRRCSPRISILRLPTG